MVWRRLFPLRKSRSNSRPERLVRLDAEALEDRVTPATMTTYEASELQVMNQFRANPTAFANDLNALYHGGAYQSPNGYAASDPIWADLRSEITDAESTLTRAQPAYLNSIHDYLIAVARLEYAMGVTPTPGSSCGHRHVGCQ